MILHCEKCQSRYLLPAHAIGAEGRKVRCSNCGHEWFQEPESDDPEDFAVPDDIEPIPESVKPLPEGGEVPALRSAPAESEADDEKPRRRGLTGWLAGMLVFLLVFGLLIVLSGPVSRAFPPAISFYGWLGIAVPVPGEGLIFDRLEAVSAVTPEGLQLLTVSGRLINLQRRPVTIPPIRATLRGADSTPLESWLIPPPAPVLDGESEISFSTSYPEIPDEAREVNLQFKLGSK